MMATKKKIKKKRYRKLSVKKKLARYRDKNGNQRESSIEKKVRILLQQLGLHFKQEFHIPYKETWKSYDFLVSDNFNYTFLIECDGFWHGVGYNERKIKLLPIQKKNIKNDRIKTKLAKDKGYPLLRLYEKDIKYNINKIKQEILNELNRQKN